MCRSTITPVPDSNRQLISRRRWIYIGLVILTIILGLATRKNAHHLPRIIGEYAPDALWAAMIYWLVAGVFQRLPVSRVVAISLAICYLDEISQLYHAPWIDAIRHTTLGGLVLGFGFLWSDIICYTVGVACAAGFDRGLIRHSDRPN
jgi:hypothetical protein